MTLLATTKSLPRSASTEERFWAKVAKTDACWLWTAATDNGYGVFQDERKVPAHRWAYTRLVGPVPSGLVLDHLCRVRSCVNPAHLEPVTHRENLLRGETHAAQNAAKTHCKRGHEFTDSNTLRADGRRYCRRCRADAARQAYWARKGGTDAAP